ncbi:MAG: exo-alpha-sialidase [Planctomycetaceae bacterium]|nr:exo-alpha-sialidase [Planctomycetaceae bacterium]
MRIVSEGVICRDPSRNVYMPVIAELSDGRLIAAQHTGSALAAPDNRLEVLFSSDQGASWTDPVCMHSQAGHEDRAAASGEWAYRAPDLQLADDGTLLMQATRFENTSQPLFDPDSEALQRAEMLLYRSADSGETWQPPEVVPVDLPPEKYTWNSTGRLELLSPERWLYHFETWKPAGWAGPPDQKAGMVVSTDRGHTWTGPFILADDTTGEKLYWDRMNCRLTDGRLYGMCWTHHYGTSADFPVHWSVSDDEGHTWSEPRPTNISGQVCSPITLPDGGVAAIYNDRTSSTQGIRLARSTDLETFDIDNQLTLFSAGEEASLGTTDHENFLAEHLLIAFGRPEGHLAADGTLLTYFWCTTGGVTHTRWARVRP